MPKFVQTTNPWEADIETEGVHQSELRYETSFRDNFCPPGTVSRRTTGKKRMRVTFGSGWYDRGNFHDNHIGSTPDLIATYNEYLAKGKVSAKGSGHDPRRWGYAWSSAAKSKAENSEKNGLPMESFVNLLKLPLHKRPKTIRECIQFFYPMSGPIPPEKNLSPFISTGIAAYAPIDSDPNKPNNIPLQLGDVSMMYGWYLVYRLLLCPDEFDAQISDILQDSAFNNKVYPFELVQESALVNSALRSKITGDLEDDIDFLSTVSSAVELISDVSSALAEGGANIPTSLADVVSLAESEAGAPVRELLKKHGAAAITSVLVRQLDIPYTYANDLASTVLEGAMAPEKWTQILNDTQARDAAIQAASQAVYQTAQKFVVSQLDDAASDLGLDINAGSLREMSKTFEDMVMTGRPSEALTAAYNTAKNKSAAFLDDREKVLIKAFEKKKSSLEKRARLKLQDFTTFGKPARENPVAILAVSALAYAVNGGIEYKKAQKIESLQRAQKYFTDNYYRLKDEFSSTDVSFDLGTHVRHGLRDGRRSIVPPDCRVQQGGQVFDYWVHVWAQVKDTLRLIRDAKAGHFARFAGTPGLDISDIPEFVIPPHLFRNLEPTKFTSALEKGSTYCQGLGILAKHSGPSMGIVLDRLGAFSPFTHAYGFSPTFYIEPSTNTLKIDGTSARRFLGLQNIQNTSGRLQPSHSPGRVGLNRERAYSQRGVECWAGETPFSSRRLLAGSYGQRCNITFDVGIDDVSPVMGAQFAGLMAVLLCHPEAVKNCKLMGFDWAQNILAPDDIVRMSNLTAITQSSDAIGQMVAQNFAKLATNALTKRPSALEQIKSRLSVIAPIAQKTAAETINEAAKSGALSRKQATLDVLKAKNFQVSPSTKLRLQKAVEQRKAAGQSLDLSKKPVTTSEIVTSAAVVTTAVAALGYLAFKVSTSGK